MSSGEVPGRRVDYLSRKFHHVLTSPCKQFHWMPSTKTSDTLAVEAAWSLSWSTDSRVWCGLLFTKLLKDDSSSKRNKPQWAAVSSDFGMERLYRAKMVVRHSWLACLCSSWTNVSWFSFRSPSSPATNLYFNIRRKIWTAARNCWFLGKARSRFAPCHLKTPWSLQNNSNCSIFSLGQGLSGIFQTTPFYQKSCNAFPRLVFCLDGFTILWGGSSRVLTGGTERLSTVVQRRRKRCNSWSTWVAIIFERAKPWLPKWTLLWFYLGGCHLCFDCLWLFN